MERAFMINRLKEEAMDCISIYGIKKTTVDELVKRVNIPKGTFYLLYQSKELLLFDVINDIHDGIQKQLLKEVEEAPGNLSCDYIVEILFRVYKEVSNTGLLSIMINGELDLLMRKLPEEIVLEHAKKDDFSMEQFFSFLPIKENINIEVYSGAFRGVFLMMLYKREIGEQIFDDTLKLMLRGLIIQLIE